MTNPVGLPPDTRAELVGRLVQCGAFGQDGMPAHICAACGCSGEAWGTRRGAPSGWAFDPRLAGRSGFYCPLCVAVLRALVEEQP